MSPKYTVWFVDDLARNRARFEANHGNDFAVETFSKTSDVLTRISNGNTLTRSYAIFFFCDTVEEAERIEKAVSDLADNLKKIAIETGVRHQTHAIGITLMGQIYEHFKKHPPPFPMYVYTPKGPLLLQQSEWDKISEYGAKILLKGRVTAESERTEILRGVEFYRNKDSWTAKMTRMAPVRFWTLAQGLFFIVLSLSIDRLVRGRW